MGKPADDRARDVWSLIRSGLLMIVKGCWGLVTLLFRRRPKDEGNGKSGKGLQRPSRYSATPWYFDLDLTRVAATCIILAVIYMLLWISPYQRGDLGFLLGMAMGIALPFMVRR